MCRAAPGLQGPQEVLALARDGTQCRIRDARPDDGAAIRRLFEAMSPRSTYQRFLSASPRAGAHYSEVLFDPRRTLDAVVATVGGELVAVGSTHQMSAHCAELAVAIADRYQGHGVGTLVLEALIDRARARGVARLVGEVMRSNAQMLDVIRHLGLGFTLSADQGVADIVIDLRESGTYDQARARRARTAVGEYQQAHAADSLAQSTSGRSPSTVVPGRRRRDAHHSARGLGRQALHRPLEHR